MSDLGILFICIIGVLLVIFTLLLIRWGQLA